MLGALHTYGSLTGFSAKPAEAKTFEYEKITDSRLEKKFATLLIDSKPQMGEAMKKMVSKK